MVRMPAKKDAESKADPKPGSSPPTKPKAETQGISKRWVVIILATAVIGAVLILALVFGLNKEPAEAPVAEVVSATPTPVVSAASTPRAGEGQVPAFDGCGSEAKYSSQPWFNAFNAAVNATPALRAPESSSAALGEICYAANAKVVVFTSSVGMLSQKVGKYLIDRNEIVLAIRDTKGNQRLENIPFDFGPQRGNVIRMTSTTGGEGTQVTCKNTYNFDYNVVDNTLVVIGTEC